MAAPYHDISRAAYVMAADAAPLTADYRALAFPEHWHHSVLALCNRGRPPEAEPYRTVPTYRMDGVLQSLAPDLIVRGRPREAQQQDGDFWLYVPASAPSPLPGDTFDRLVGAWLRDLRPDPDDYQNVLATLSELRTAPPRWEDITLDLLACPSTDGGTAAPLGYQYQLAPDAIARRILTLDPYDTGAGTLHFRASPRGPRQQGAELISQPLQYVDQGPGLVVFHPDQHLPAHRPFRPPAPPPPAHRRTPLGHQGSIPEPASYACRTRGTPPSTSAPPFPGFPARQPATATLSRGSPATGARRATAGSTTAPRRSSATWLSASHSRIPRNCSPPLKTGSGTGRACAPRSSTAPTSARTVSAPGSCPTSARRSPRGPNRHYQQGCAGCLP